MAFKILAIGEILWDLLPSGPQVGGAPANYACHAKALGADVPPGLTRRRRRSGPRNLAVFRRTWTAD